MSEGRYIAYYRVSTARQGASALGLALNAHGIRTARGGKWYPATVRNVLAREARLRRREDRAA